MLLAIMVVQLFLHLFLNMPWYDFIPENTWYPGSDIVGEQIGTGDGERTKFATAFAFAKKCNNKKLTVSP